MLTSHKHRAHFSFGDAGTEVGWRIDGGLSIEGSPVRQGESPTQTDNGEVLLDLTGPKGSLRYMAPEIALMQPVSVICYRRCVCHLLGDHRWYQLCGGNVRDSSDLM